MDLSVGFVPLVKAYHCQIFIWLTESTQIFSDALMFLNFFMWKHLQKLKGCYVFDTGEAQLLLL